MDLSAGLWYNRAQNRWRERRIAPLASRGKDGKLLLPSNEVVSERSLDPFRSQPRKMLFDEPTQLGKPPDTAPS